MGDFSLYISRIVLGWRICILAVVAWEFLSPGRMTVASLADTHQLVKMLTPTIGFAIVAMWTFIACGLSMMMSPKERGPILAVGDIAVAAAGCLALPKSLACILLFSLPPLDLASLGAGAVVAGGIVSAAAYPGVLAAEGKLAALGDLAAFVIPIFMGIVCGLLVQVQQRQEAQSEAVLSVIRTSQELGTSASLEKILTVATRDIKSLFECSTCVIYLRDFHDPDSTFIKVARAESPKQKYFIEFDLEQKDSIITAVVDSRQATLVDDFQAYPGEDVIKRDAAFRSTLVAPLMFEDRALGALFISHQTPGFYKVSALHLLTLLANQLGVAARNVQLQRTTETLAITDSLSGLFTHGHFQSSLDEQIKESKYTTKKPLSLLILDLDFFKKVNDTYGHPQGDALLKQLGAIIKRIARPTDIVCRYGGDEFTVIMPHTSLDEAALAAEKIRAAVEEYDFALGRQLVHVTLSGGVATFPDGAVDKLELISNADQAMYKAKQAGRNRIVKPAAGGRKKFEAVGAAGRTVLPEQSRYGPEGTPPAAPAAPDPAAPALAPEPDPSA